MAQRNQFVDDILSDKTSLIHLLDSNDDEDNKEAHIIKHSPYYGETDFSNLLVEKPGFSILNMNIQSVNAKFDEFQSFVSRMNIINPISAICLQECWLGDADNVTMFNLENYEMTFLPKSCCAHGGLIIYVHKQFECRVMTEVVVQASGWEYVCVKVSHRKPQSKIYVLCNIYRKPNEIVDDLDTFTNELSSLLYKIKNLKHSSYVCGDFNIDLLKVKENRHYCKYFDKIIAHGLFHKITLPTRICESSSTLIDNIFTDNIDEVGTSGILLNQISDHQMMFTLVENRSYVINVPKFIDIECNDHRSMQAFIRELEDNNIHDKLEQAIDSDPQENYARFIALLNDAKNKHLPRKRVRFNKHKHKKSKWMTNGILKSIKTKDTLYKKLVKANIDDEIAYTNLKAEFTDYKKILRRSINEAKHSYYARTFALYKNDIKQTWSVTKDTLQRKKQSKTTAQFILNNRIITDLDEIANEFNAYFVDIGRLLSEQIHSDSSSQDYLLQRNKPNMNFNFVQVNEVYIDNVINKLKNKSSSGYDNISNKHIKYARSVLIKPLTLLINQCLHTGVYPSQLEMSRVKPLFKSGDKSLFSNCCFC